VCLFQLSDDLRANPVFFFCVSDVACSTVSKDKDTAKREREKDLIARQLQLLFARLQCAEQRAAKTKDLTMSFGWTDDDAFTQHDVQELMRVLFDALTTVLKGSSQGLLRKLLCLGANKPVLTRVIAAFSELWEGKMVDYVTCQECNKGNSREDTFMDIPLVIRGFGETEPVKSVEEALRKFISTLFPVSTLVVLPFSPSQLRLQRLKHSTEITSTPATIAARKPMQTKVSNSPVSRIFSLFNSSDSTLITKRCAGLS
jgi:Ubiquitin carboxyl-terminal hydrolase